MEAGQGDRTCFLWEGNEPGTSYRMTYKEVLHETCRLVFSPPPPTSPLPQRTHAAFRPLDALWQCNL